MRRFERYVARCKRSARVPTERCGCGTPCNLEVAARCHPVRSQAGTSRLQQPTDGAKRLNFKRQENVKTKVNDLEGVRCANGLGLRRWGRDLLDPLVPCRTLTSCIGNRQQPSFVRRAHRFREEPRMLSVSPVRHSDAKCSRRTAIARKAQQVAQFKSELAFGDRHKRCVSLCHLVESKSDNGEPGSPIHFELFKFDHVRHG